MELSDRPIAMEQDMNLWITEALAREHVADLRGRPRPATMPTRRRLRTGDALGWWLIHLGLRLVTTDAHRMALPREALPREAVST
jgi:hypothetical protein